MSNKSHYWFKRRRYGWGWTPATWQGWATLVALLIIVVGAGVYILPEKSETPTSLQLVTFFLIFLSAMLFAIGISYAKGPAPRWRWGKSDSDNPDEDF